jgi:GNAT superfamily N-acetyltransferase
LNEISIEPAHRKHLDAIPRIELAAAAMFSEADLPVGLRFLVTELEDLQIAQEHERLWMAVTAEGNAVGFAMADILDGVAHLDEMDVLPRYSRRGIGTQLLRRFIAWARAAGYPCATLVTFRHLAWNAPFYEKFGFVAMDPTQIGAEVAGMLEAEARAGIDTSNRTCMRLQLSDHGI